MPPTEHQSEQSLHKFKIIPSSSEIIPPLLPGSTLSVYSIGNKLTYQIIPPPNQQQLNRPAPIGARQRNQKEITEENLEVCRRSELDAPTIPITIF